MKKKSLLNTLILAALFATQLNAQSLLTDSLYGNNGIIQVPVFNGQGGAKNIFRQTDDKILICGTMYESNCNCNHNFMFRADACGQVDSSFGVNGLVRHKFEFTNIGNDYTLQPDGKILVAGTQAAGNGSSQFRPSISRYNYDGNPDTTFGVMGSTSTSFQNGEFTFLYLLPDGKILCSGSQYTSNHLIMRFDSTGAVDNTFGTNGVVQHPTPLGLSLLRSFISAMRSDGKIISVSSDFFNGQLVLSCYDTLGIEDTTFGVNGYIVDPIFIVGGATKILLQNNDKLIVASRNSAQTAATIARYNTNGSIDTTFGTLGYINVSGAGWLHFVTKLNDDSFIIGYDNGFSCLNCSQFYKYSADGIPDPSFSLDGGNVFTFPGPAFEIADIGITSSNNEMIFGSSHGFNNGKMSLKKYYKAPSLPNITQTGFTLSSNVNNDGATFQWFLNGTAISNATDSIYTATQPGTYTVEVTNIWGCTLSDAIVLTNTGIETANGLYGVSFYPNPVKETLTIVMPSATINSDYFILDAVGRIVLTGKTLREKTTVDMHSFSPGIYFLKITSLQGNSIVKVLKD